MMSYEEICEYTPCFIVDKALLSHNLKTFKRAMKQYWNRHIFGYSVKTNSLPYILTQIKKFGCYAEVVSDTEYQLAITIGFQPEQIIFNGPIKGRDQFFEALKHKSIINIDSTREIDWLCEADAMGLYAEVGLRVSFNLAAVCPEEDTEDHYSNRFGFNVENGRFEDALTKLHSLPHISVIGLHMHTNSKARSLNVFRELAKKSCELAVQHHMQLKYVDIGGSFFVGRNDDDAYDHYIRTIAEQLRTTFSPEETALIIEPGAAVISTPIQYLTKVIDVKDTYKERFVITDGGRLHVDPFLRKTHLDYELKTTSVGAYARQVICGFSCMDSDRIMTLSDAPALQTGDYIIYNVVGSYTMCFNSLFIDYLPSVFVKADGQYKQVREKWGVNEYLQKNLYES